MQRTVCISLNRFKRVSFYSLFIPILFIASAGQADRRVTTKRGADLEGKEGKREHVHLPPDLEVPEKWKHLVDPSQQSFWKEGNHVPDEGFLLWATEPTIENAKLFLIRMNAKRDVLHLMQEQQEKATIELIRAGLIKDDYNFLAQVSPRVQHPSVKDFSLRDTHIFFFFNPSCPYCEEQAKELHSLNNVTPLQVGGTALKRFDGLPPSVWAEQEDISRYLSDGQLPVMVVFNQKTNQMTLLKGKRPLAQLKQAASSLEQSQELTRER